ncbi:polymer-forming cytoskeletal protein [Amphibacillus indicireducens]|uniref:Polymer-forming cytoskeletal protein n=1 Tax=Amphibacillus indicireducens TaxID=1076330 RepID=A0ABP7W3Z3_9BACI
MFSRKKKHKVLETIIGKDTIIEGKIKLPTSLRIDGKVYGAIECEGNVYIGKSGYTEPAIQAKNVIVAGEANGEIKTSEKIQIHASGKITGKIVTEGLVIEEGGIFNGNSTIHTPNRKTKPEPIKIADTN